MPSPKLIQILRSKTDLSDEEIIPLTDQEAWSKIYAVDAEKRKTRPPKSPEVFFTGFSLKEKEFIVEKIAFTENGHVINSDFLNGLTTEKAKNKIIEVLE